MRFTQVFSKSLRYRLLLYFTLLMMVPVSITGYLIYTVSDKRVSDGALRMAKQIVEKDNESINEALADIQAAAGIVTRDETIQSILSDILSHESGRDEYVRLLGNRLKQISNDYKGINGIYIWLDNGTIAKSRYYSILEQPRLSNADYWSIRNHAHLRWFMSNEGSMITDNMGDAVLGVAVSLPLRESGQPGGIVIVETKRSYLRELMSSDFGENGAIILVNSKDDIVLQGAGSDETVVRSAVEQTKKTAVGLRMEVIDVRDRVYILDRVTSTGWVLTGVVFKESLRDDSKGILLVFVIITLIAFVLNVFISRCLANYELEPINRMREYILRVEDGEFGLPLPSKRDDEIGELTASIQEMSQKIGMLLENVKMEQERVRSAEFKALQAQINPHFLYNSLDSINWLVRKQNIEKATEMISALTTFFRIGLSKGKDIITVKEELEHIRSYLIIQKIRYENQFEYSLYIDPDTEKYYVPKLMLQPLVENALYHGIKPCNRKCILMVQVFLREEQIELEVLDNGVGMDAETLEAVYEAINHEGINRSNSYGVVNVNDRIRLLAGHEYGLIINSERDVGTSVRIVLPLILKEG